MQILNPGGTLLTYSCSGLMDQVLFQKIIADAALDAGRDVKFVERFEQAADHPTDTAYPEGFISKALLVRFYKRWRERTLASIESGLNGGRFYLPLFTFHHAVTPEFLRRQ